MRRPWSSADLRLISVTSGNLRTTTTVNDTISMTNSTTFTDDNLDDLVWIFVGIQMTKHRWLFIFFEWPIDIQTISHHRYLALWTFHSNTSAMKMTKITVYQRNTRFYWEKMEHERVSRARNLLVVKKDSHAHMRFNFFPSRYFCTCREPGGITQPCCVTYPA